MPIDVDVECDVDILGNRPRAGEPQRPREIAGLRGGSSCKTIIVVGAPTTSCAAARVAMAGSSIACRNAILFKACCDCRVAKWSHEKNVSGDDGEVD
jgi:hypothetical protein